MVATSANIITKKKNRKIVSIQMYFAYDLNLLFTDTENP